MSDGEEEKAHIYAGHGQNTITCIHILFSLALSYGGWCSNVCWLIAIVPLRLKKVGAKRSAEAKSVRRGDVSWFGDRRGGDVWCMP